jgi:hypothetical protein
MQVLFPVTGRQTIQLNLYEIVTLRYLCRCCGAIWIVLLTAENPFLFQDGAQSASLLKEGARHSDRMYLPKWKTCTLRVRWDAAEI